MPPTSPDKPAVTVYTDGGAKPNPGPGGWGARLIASGGQVKDLSGHSPDTTNNRMELTAAIEALRALKQPCRVALHTDSQYLRRGITEWLPGWIKRSWQRAKDQEVMNQDLWQALEAETRRHEIEWHWVKGHAGDEHNEAVDRLATAAREQLTGPDPAASAPPTASAQADIAPEVEIALRVSLPKAGGKGAWAVRVATIDEGGMGTAHTETVPTAASTSQLELLAAIRALESVPPGTPVRVYCPSDYLYRGMTEWVSGWQRRGWKTSSKQPVKHKDLWQTLLRLVDERPAQWTPEGSQRPAIARGLDKLAADALT